MTQQPRSARPGQVRRRAVLYLPGYDPFPPRRYRELYRVQAAAQAAISGYEIALRPRPGAGFGWCVHARMGGAAVKTDMQVLVWSDLVRASMAPSIAVTYWLMLRTAWVYLSSGALPRLARLRRGPLVAALLPVALLLGQLALALLAGWATAGGLRAVLAAMGAGTGPLPWALGAGAGVAACGGALRWFKSRDGRIFAYYLMHDFAFFSGQRGTLPRVLARRLADFGQVLDAAMASDVDEVLVVGHSSGAHLAVSLVAGHLRRAQAGQDGPALSLLTLGQVIPMLSFLPRAGALRADLHDLSRTDRITWLDVSAPGDGCAFALCDPVAVSGVAPARGKRWPLVLSAAFSRTLSPGQLRALRWRYLRLHLQYLCAFDRPGDYDYFRITAGPRTLGARFEGRRPSPARIETPLSPHRGRAVPA